MKRSNSLDELRSSIRGDFVRACDTLYYIRPRSVIDPETGDPREVEESGLIPFRLFPDQARTARVMLDQQRRQQPVRVVKVKPRQSGDSTFGSVWQFHNVYWGRNQHGLTLAHHDTTTQSLYAMTQTLFAELPPELQVLPKKLNRKELAWERPYANSIIAQTAGFMDIGHGLTIHHVHISEIDLYPDQDVVLEGVMETVAMAPGTSIYIESKAQGLGWLYQFWNASKRGETGFTPLFTAWYQVPEYRLPVPDDFEPSAEEREWMAEFSLKLNQIMWYRTKKRLMIAKEPWGGDRRMKSSYPFTDVEAFQASGFCVFPDTELARLRDGIAPPLAARRLEAMPTPGQFREVPIDIDPRRPGLWIWEEPHPDSYYSLGVDISDGVGQTESVVSVLKYPGYRQVAEWFSTVSSVEETAYVARYLAEKWGGMNSLIIPEINRNGSLILHILFNLPGHYSIFRWRYLDRPGMEMNDNPKLGWDTNHSTKRALIQVANLIFLRGQGHVRSAVLHEQMTRCLDLTTGSKATWAAEGGKSDRVLAYLIAIIGAYLDYEGGSVGNIVSERRQHLPSVEIPNWREPATFDAGVEEVYSGRVLPMGSAFWKTDLEDR